MTTALLTVRRHRQEPPVPTPVGVMLSWLWRNRSKGTPPTIAARERFVMPLGINPKEHAS